MDLFRGKLIIYTLSYGLIISALVGFGVYHLHPEFNRHWFLGTSAFFLIIEIALVLFMATASRHHKKKNLINLYMLTKVIKLMASLIFVTTYIFVVKHDVTAFVTVFILFYLLYLFIETVIFIRIEKNIKEKKDE